ncbi:MAG: hypothetical protein HGA37_04315 [Lentimicrobium sp.]|nr:hypothetical protein [Lentimicrobium sp.]
MNKNLRTLVCLIALVGFAVNMQAQSGTEKSVNPSSSSFSDEELANYKKQAIQLVTFMEFTFNTLGVINRNIRRKILLLINRF